MPLLQGENFNPLYAHLISIMSLDPTTKIMDHLVGAYPNFLRANQCCVDILFTQICLPSMSRVYIFTLIYFFQNQYTLIFKWIPKGI
jgi:hypothetical protein